MATKSHPPEQPSPDWEPERRVRYLMRMMRELRWRRGKSGRVLAPQFGISHDQMKRDASEAWRRVKAEVTDPERVRGDVCTTIAKVLHDSLRDAHKGALIVNGKRVYRESPSVPRKIALEACKLWAEVTGANAPETVLNVNVGAQTPADAQRVMRQFFKGFDDDAAAPAVPDGGGSPTDAAGNPPTVRSARG